MPIDPARRLVPSTTDDHPIHWAAEAGDARGVARLLDGDPALVRDVNRAGGHPLHRAVIGGSREVVALLLDRGADIHAVHGAGRGSAAGYAPQDKQPIDLAIWGGPIQVPASRWRCFVASAKWHLWKRRRWNGQSLPRRPELARDLIARGASYDLTVAAALGDFEQVKAMLDANPSRISEDRPDARRPLTAAAEFGRLDIVRLLLERGADPTWPDVDESSRGAALHAAARTGNLPMVQLLLDHGADPNGNVDSAGNALFAAKTPEIRRLLRAHGGTLDPYDLVFLGDEDAVMQAIAARPESAYDGCGGVYPAVVTLGKRRLLNRLLDAGVKVHPRAGGCHGYLLEQPDMLKALLERGGLDPDYPTEDGVTLLHELCYRDVRGRTQSHRTQCAGILLAAGAQLSPKTRNGETPLAWAIKNGLADMEQWLKARGAVSVVLAMVAASCTNATAHSSARMADGKEWTTANLNVASAPSYCYEDTDSHCSEYGRLYTWDSAKTGCQSLGNGWRLPTDEEWHALAKGYGGLLGESADEGKTASSPLLMGGAAGFNAMKGGSRMADGRYERRDAHGLYWTASESGAGTAWMYNFGSLGLSRHKGGDKQMAISVRCIRVPAG